MAHRLESRYALPELEEWHARKDYNSPMWAWVGGVGFGVLVGVVMTLLVTGGLS